MGWFKKKSDPISERAQALNEQIAQLEQQIAELSGQMQEGSVPETEATVPTPVLPSPPASPVTQQPRLRSTALPRSQGVVVHGAPSTPAPPPPSEPVFEELPGNPFKNGVEAPEPSEPQPELGVRKSGAGEFLRRIASHFKGPPTNNPKLVNYLAAGSIQGLRPLRYEKRVARNRVIALVILLVLILWGIVSVILRRP